MFILIRLPFQIPILYLIPLYPDYLILFLNNIPSRHRNKNRRQRQTY